MEAEPVLRAAPDPAARPPNRVVGIGASAGGVEALRHIVALLPGDYPGAICIVLHIPATGRNLLAPILDRHSRLTAVLAADGDALRAGTIYVAPADHHLLVRRDVVELNRGPKENGARPAVDPMFRSLARAWGPHAVAVVLSGALDDGASGALTIAEQGGTVIVQDPDDALVPGMPASAISATVPDHVAPLDEIAAILVDVVTGSAEQREEESAMSSELDDMEESRHRPDGPATGFTCPECSGAIWELREGELTRYRCRIGHTYSEDAFIEAQGASVEAALWTALEALEERSELLRRIADRTTSMPRTERRLREGAREAGDRAEIIRRALAGGRGDAGLGRDHVEERTAS